MYADTSSAGYRSSWNLTGKRELDEAAGNLLRSLQAISDGDSDEEASPSPRREHGRQHAPRRTGDSSAEYADLPRRSPPPSELRRTLAYQASPSGGEHSAYSSPQRVRQLASSSSTPALPRSRMLAQTNGFRATGYSVLGDVGAASHAAPKSQVSYAQQHMSSPQQFSALRENMVGGGQQHNGGYREDARARTKGRDEELQKVREELNGLKLVHNQTVRELAHAKKAMMQVQSEWTAREQRHSEDKSLCEEIGRMRREADGLKRELQESRHSNSEVKRLQAHGAQLEELLTQERQKVTRIEKERSKLQQSCTALSSSLEAQGQELSQHRRQSQNLNQEVSELRRQHTDGPSRDELLEQNKRLKEEVKEQQLRHRNHQKEVAAKLVELQRRYCEEQAKMQEENDQLKAKIQEGDEAMQRQASSTMTVLEAAAGKTPSRAQEKLQQENKRLQAEIHDRIWTLKRVESEQEKVVQGYSNFIESVSSSSASPVLDKLFDLRGAELLGMGNYGYVMTCSQKASGETVVLKVQSTRWVDVAVKEWNHGAGLTHRNIVEFKQVLLHNDADRVIRERLRAGFDDGTLNGKRPKILPDTYICTVLEYMDCGTVSSMMEKNLISLDGVAAITRQVSSALAYMHQSKRTHNDIKPENLLLRKSPNGNHLLVKLADLGLAAHSVDRTRDIDLFAYTIWCMVCGQNFQKCPKKEERDNAMSIFRRSPLLGIRANDRSQALIEVVTELWRGSLTMADVESKQEFQGCEVQIPVAQEALKHLRMSSQVAVANHALVACTKFATLAEHARRRHEPRPNSESSNE